MSLQIVPVQSRQQLRQFFQLRQTVYRDDPAMVFPLRSVERQLVDASRHPFYQHARRELFLALRNGQPVGRIAGIVDTLHQEYHGDRTGFFGFFEAVDDQAVVEALVAAASDWLKAQGCDRIRGPVNPSMKGEFGVLVEGHEHPPSIMLAHTPARYRQQLIDTGLDVIREFHAYAISVEDYRRRPEMERQLMASCQRLNERFPDLEMRSASRETFVESMRQINELGNRVRSEGWGFVPLTDAELDFMIHNLRRVIRYEMIQMAFLRGKMVGYIVNIPDINWALKRTRGKSDLLRMVQLLPLLRRCARSRVIALGVDADFRTKGIAMLLIAELIRRADSFREWEFSWVDSENLKSIRAIARAVPLKKLRSYQLLEGPLR